MRLGVLLAALGVAVCLAGTASAAAPTRTEFIRRGDNLCARMTPGLVALYNRSQAAQRLPENRKLAAATEIWVDQVAFLKKFAARFRAIGVPPNDRAARSLVARLSRGVVLAVRVQRALAARDVAKLGPALQSYAGFTIITNRLTRAYGFRVCGSGP